MKPNSDGVRDAGKIRVGWLVADEAGPNARDRGFSVVVRIVEAFDKFTFHLADGRNVGPCAYRDLVLSALPGEETP